MKIKSEKQLTALLGEMFRSVKVTKMLIITLLKDTCGKIDYDL